MSKMPSEELLAGALGTCASVDFVISPGLLVGKRSVSRGSASPVKLPSTAPGIVTACGCGTE